MFLYTLIFSFSAVFTVSAKQLSCDNVSPQMFEFAHRPKALWVTSQMMTGMCEKNQQHKISLFPNQTTHENCTTIVHNAEKVMGGIIQELKVCPNNPGITSAKVQGYYADENECGICIPGGAYTYDTFDSNCGTCGSQCTPDAVYSCSVDCYSAYELCLTDPFDPECYDDAYSCLEGIPGCCACGCYWGFYTCGCCGY